MKSFLGRNLIFLLFEFLVADVMFMSLRNSRQNLMLTPSREYSVVLSQIQRLTESGSYSRTNSWFLVTLSSVKRFFTITAVLSQLSEENSKWHPVACYSKSLSAVEQNYNIYNKEMLAIIWAMEEWRHFLEGAKHPLEIWMDHKNLEYFWTT